MARAENAWERADEVGALPGELRAAEDNGEVSGSFQDEQARTTADAAMVEAELTRRPAAAEQRVRDNLAQSADLLAKSASWERTMPALAFTACTLISPTYISAWNTPEEKTAVDEAHAKGRACVQRLAPDLRKAAALPVVLDVSALPEAERSTLIDRVKSVVPPAVTWTTDRKATTLRLRLDSAAVVTPPQTEQTTISHTWVTGSRTVDNPEFRTLQTYVMNQQQCLMNLPGYSFRSSNDINSMKRQTGCSYYCSSLDCATGQSAAAERGQGEAGQDIDDDVCR